MNVPTEEIEISPAMLKAGTLALAMHDNRFEEQEEAAEAVFRAMMEVKIRESRTAASSGGL